MSNDQTRSEGTPEASVEARLGELDDAYLQLLGSGQDLASDPFYNAFHNA
jgi:hypothetical protein